MEMDFWFFFSMNEYLTREEYSAWLFYILFVISWNVIKTASRIIRTLFALTHLARLPIVDIISRVNMNVFCASIHQQKTIHMEYMLKANPPHNIIAFYIINCQPRHLVYYNKLTKWARKKVTWKRNETSAIQIFHTTQIFSIWKYLVCVEWCWMWKVKIHAFKLPSHRWCHIHICYSLWVGVFVVVVVGGTYEKATRCKMICTTGDNMKNISFCSVGCCFFAVLCSFKRI